MNLSESFRIALTSLTTNRMRAVLTTLGIVIGVGAVTGLVSLGRGVENYVTKQFTDLGANTITITSTTPENDANAKVQALTNGESNDISNPQTVPSAASVASIYSVSAIVSAGSESVSMSVSGVTPSYTEVNNWHPSIGAFITAEDVNENRRVAVLGQDTVDKLFGSKSYNPVGLSIQINGRVFTVIGVMAAKGSSLSSEEYVFVPISTAQTRLDNARVSGGDYEVTQIQAAAVSQDAVITATQEIQRYLTEAHHILYSGDEDFSVSNQGSLLDSITQIVSILTIFLAVVAGISLLVGGIGIMNIMLVSVTERTREIGLRKAIGARGRDILSQFLVESIILSFVGGLFGIALGWLVTVVGSALVPDLQLSLTLDAVALATAVTSFIGIFFGLYPASRAAAMRPIDALRYE